MYYTSSGGGNSKTSGYSGEDDGHQYYGTGTGLPAMSGSGADPSSRMMSGAGMSYAAGMEYGQRSQTAYAPAGSWLNSSLESAQRSLQSWKSVGLSAGSAAAPLGNERLSGMDPLANRTSVRLPAPEMSESRPPGQAVRGMIQSRPRPPMGVQTFQPRGGAQLRGGGPAAASGQSMSSMSMSSSATAGFRNSGPEYGQGQSQAAQRAVPPAQQLGFDRRAEDSMRGPAHLPPPPPPPEPPMPMSSTAAAATAAYRNSGQVGSEEYSQRQNQAAQRTAAPVQQPGFGRGTPASFRGPSPRGPNVARAPRPPVPSTSPTAPTSNRSSGEVGQGQNQTASLTQKPGFGRGTATSLMSLTPRAPKVPVARTPGPPVSVPSTSATATTSYGNSGEVDQGQNQAASPPQKPEFGRGLQASVRGPIPRAASATQTFRPGWLKSMPDAGSRATTASPAISGPMPLMNLTPFQARLQEFSTKTCGDLGISVQQQLDSKKRCRLEGFSTKTEDATSSQKEEIEHESDDDDDDDDDDDNVDMTQCKLCNIKFEKEQVLLLLS